MVNVLFLDRSNPIVIDWIRAFAKYMLKHVVNVLFLTDKEKSSIYENLEILNVNDVRQAESLETLQAKYTFSIFKTLVPERSFFDYSSFRKNQCYARLSLEEIGEKITPYVNALDYIIREKADLVIEGLADNFMTALAGMISNHYSKAFRMQFVYYWWPDGMLMVDRMDQTSSDIDQLYEHHLSHPEGVDKAQLDKRFNGPKIKVSYSGAGAGKYKLGLRLKQLRNRAKSYEPFSLVNWISRRLSWFFSALLIKCLIHGKNKCPVGEKFVFFPLHVSPEATLLGSNPELADQFTIIKNISMNLPWGVKLYVKDHPHQVVGAGLNYDFYRRLNTLPNVVYINKEVSFNEIVASNECVAVAVISGTVGLEAALMRKHVFVFGNPIYKAASCFIKPYDFIEFYKKLMDVMAGSIQFDDAALYAILKAIDSSVIRGQDVFVDNPTWEDVSYASFPILERCILEKSGRLV